MTSLINTEDLIAAFRESAAECEKSSVGNGEYNISFYVVMIVLSALADRVEARAALSSKGES